MATLYISEYRFLSNIPLSTNYTPVPGQAPQEPSTTDQIVAISGSPTQSQPFGTFTSLVRLHCDAICSVAFGATPTATTSSKRLAAGQTEYFGVSPGQSVSVISNV